jgi:hypothetical protein
VTAVAQRTPAALDRIRARIHERLEGRRAEIESALLNRIYGISDPSDIDDPEYLEGLRTAVTAALDYGLTAIERGDERAPPVPAVLLVQARTAARIGISLDTVLRRYFAGYALLGDFLLEEVENGGLLSGSALKSLMGTQAALFDRLLAGVSEEYSRAAQQGRGTTEERRAERVQRLLAGELLDTSDIEYDFDAHHLGAIATGEGAYEAIRDLAGSLDCRPLLVRRDESVVWAWLGARRNLDPCELETLASERWPAQLPLAIGEPAQGLFGWRVTYQQARAALPIAIRRGEGLVRYADVALLASMLQDDVLSTSLRELYLLPLEAERDGGDALRETLEAYLASGRNVSSAAAALGVTRRTVSNRLRAVEVRLNRPLGRAMPALEAALQLRELKAMPTATKD